MFHWRLPLNIHGFKMWRGCVLTLRTFILYGTCNWFLIPNRRLIWTNGVRKIRMAYFYVSMMMAITSPKRVGELQALSSDPRYLQVFPLVTSQTKSCLHTKDWYGREQGIWDCLPLFWPSNGSWFRDILIKILSCTYDFKVLEVTSALEGLMPCLCFMGWKEETFWVSKPIIWCWVRTCTHIVLVYAAYRVN